MASRKSALTYSTYSGYYTLVREKLEDNSIDQSNVIAWGTFNSTTQRKYWLRKQYFTILQKNRSKHNSETFTVAVEEIREAKVRVKIFDSRKQC